MAKKVRIQENKKVSIKATPPSAKPLWEDDDDEELDEHRQQVGDGDDRREKISINSKFAQEFERKKQRQELQDLQKEKALLGDDDDEDDDSSTSSSEDEDGDLLITPAMDVQVLKTIQALKRKDDAIYDPNVKFFPSTDSEDDSDSDDDDDDQPNTTTKTTKKRFKDVIREQILEDVEKMDQEQTKKQQRRKRGTDDSDDDEETNLPSTHFNAADRLAYDEEQRQLRKAFLQTNNSDSDNDDDDGNRKDKKSEKEDWLVVKKRHQPTTEDEELYVKELVNLEQVVKSSSKKSGNDKKKKAVTGKAQQPDLVDPRGEVEDGEQFLLEFLKKKKWKDTTTMTSQHDEDEDDEDEKDGKDNDSNDGNEDNDDSSLEQLEKTEAFESEYNFRFEQTEASGATLSLQSYARGNVNNSSIAAGLLRRPDDTRRERRLARLQRKAEERQAKEDQLRRLKNAKRQELQEKLNQIQSILGPTTSAKSSSSSKAAAVMDEATLMKLLEGDFDPDQFEQVMKETYGDDFYEQPDEEWKSDADVKKSFESGAVDEDDKEIAAAMLVVQEGEDEDEEMEDAGDEQEDYEEEDEAFLQKNKKNHAKEETEIEKKLKAKMLDELYKLDYEDIVAGIPTRFKYRQVEPNDYGLSTQEILMARDSLLQQVVSLKQMAPYREGEYTVNSKKRRRFRDLLQQDVVEGPTQQDEKQAETERTHAEDGAADPSKKKRRRQKKHQKQASEEVDDKVGDDAVKAKDTNFPNNEDTAAAEMEKDKNEEEGGTAKSKRRRRKKKSGAATLNDHKEATTSPAEVSVKGTDLTVTKKKGENHDAPSQLSSDSKEPVQLKDDKSDHNTSLSPTKKKKKSKKKKLAVKGVSATRFASYGLALAMLVMLSSWDNTPVARGWLSHSLTPRHPFVAGRQSRGLIVRLREQADPAGMKLREIQAELKDKGVSFADCFDRESLSKRLLEARQGLIPEPNKSQTTTATTDRETSSPSSTGKAELFDRNAVAAELRSRSVKELREECAQRRIRWSTFIEKDELVQALVEAREVAANFSASGAIVPGQVGDLTDEQLTMELQSASSRQISTPLLLDVYATWCGPCQIMAPQLTICAHELGPEVRVAKLDSDKNPMWPNRLKVGALPTVIVFDSQGRELERVEGALMKDALVQLARRHVTG